MTHFPHFRTRLAPSPTGSLHLGHVLHLLYVQGIAQELGASIALRLEDHDQGRCRPEFEASILRDLEWLGIQIPEHPWRQSARHNVYQNQLENLMKRGLVYACRCSRRDIQTMTGMSSGELKYPGTCRHKNYPLNDPGTSIRLKIDELPIDGETSSVRGPKFRDLLLDEETYSGESPESGDVVIRDRNGYWTYQFTVVIDDLEQGINLIIRGRDLLSSTARQLAMRKIFSPDANTPLFAHHPLLVDNDGEKLAKRKSSEAVSNLRSLGFTADQVRGLAAFNGGLVTAQRSISFGEKLNLGLNI